jgi:1-acyl-sn-glycerol-3-phosphate acyltransferase
VRQTEFSVHPGSELESEIIVPRTPQRLVAWRDRHQALVVVAAVAATIASLGAVPYAPTTLVLGLGLVALFWIAFGALEPALVVVVSAAAGSAWGLRASPYAGWPPDKWLENGFFVGALLAAMLVQRRLALFRRLPARGDTAVATVSFFAATLLAGVLLARGDSDWPLVALPVLSAVLLAPIGMNILLALGKESGTPRLVHLLGGAWVFAFLAFVQITLLCFIRPFLRLRGRNEEQRLARLRALSRSGTQRLFAWFPYGRLELVGASAESFRKPSVVVSNHQSSVDIPLVLSLPGDIRLTLKKRVWDAPWLGIAAQELRHVLVEPEKPAATLERCRAVMAEGASVHFFPEGTRAHDVYPRRFHRGAFDVAVELGCDVVPVVLCDTRMCVPRDAWWVEDFHMVVKVLPPITPANFDYAAGARELMKHAQELVRVELTRELERIHTPAYLAYKVRRHYRYLGRSVERRVARELASESLRALLGEAVPEEGTLLDLYCGLGVRSNWLREKRPRLRVHGLDPDPDAIRVAHASAAGTERLTFASGAPADWQLPEANAAILSARDPALVTALLPRLKEAIPAGSPLFLLEATKEARGLCIDAGFTPSGGALSYVRGMSS